MVITQLLQVILSRGQECLINEEERVKSVGAGSAHALIKLARLTYASRVTKDRYTRHSLIELLHWLKVKQRYCLLSWEFVTA